MVLSIHQLTKSFADRVILDNVSLTIEEGDRIGFIGINGAGKSTLLNCILHPSQVDTGDVFLERGQTIGYLQQNAGVSFHGCIYDEMRAVFKPLLEAQSEMRAIEEQLSIVSDHDSDQYRTLSERYATLSAYFEVQEGYQIDVKIKTILTGMGFSDKAYSTPIATLSGGEKTRLALAKLLLEQPSLLILDEPTNHLDFRTLQWLEDYLCAYKGAILVVSHDRYFLDKMVDKIWELSCQKVFTYKGNYSKFKLLKQERITRELKEYEQQQNKIASMQEYAEKNIARASTSTSARSRLKQLSHIDVLDKPQLFDKTPHFKFTYERAPVKDVLTVEHMDLIVGQGHSEKTLLRDIEFTVKRGDRIALIGPNGIGKSTLLKALLDENSRSVGDVIWGRNVQTAYYEQENLNLDFEDTVLQELWRRHPNMMEFQVRSVLGQMLISDDQVYKSVGVISGGERARLGFAVMVTEHANFLFFDEPTNHLDLASKEALEEALQEFDGTLLFVSHDRYFLNNIPTKIIEMTPDGLIVHNGNYDDYVARQKPQPVVEVVEEKQKAGAQSYYKSKQQRSEDAKRRTRISTLEKQMEALAIEIFQLEESIASNDIGTDYAKLQELCARLEEAKVEESIAEEEWLTLQEE